METKIPEHFKNSKLFNWEGVYYYKQHPCEKVDSINTGIVIDHYGDRAGSFDIYDTGYIFGRTICGNVYLKIK